MFAEIKKQQIDVNEVSKLEAYSWCSFSNRAENTAFFSAYTETVAVKYGKWMSLIQSFLLCVVNRWMSTTTWWSPDKSRLQIPCGDYPEFPGSDVACHRSVAVPVELSSSSVHVQTVRPWMPTLASGILATGCSCDNDSCHANRLTSDTGTIVFSVWTWIGRNFFPVYCFVLLSSAVFVLQLI